MGKRRADRVGTRHRAGSSDAHGASSPNSLPRGAPEPPAADTGSRVLIPAQASHLPHPARVCRPTG